MLQTTKHNSIFDQFLVGGGGRGQGLIGYEKLTQPL